MNDRHEPDGNRPRTSRHRGDPSQRTTSQHPAVRRFEEQRAGITASVPAVGAASTASSPPAVQRPAPQTGDPVQPMRRRRPGSLGIVMLPGVALWRRRPVAAALLFAAGVTAPLFAMLMLWQHRDDLVGLLTRPNVLLGMMMVALAALASRALAVWLTAEQIADPADRRRHQIAGMAAVALLAIPTAIGVVRLQQTRDVVTTVFQQSSDVGRVEAHVTVANDPIKAEDFEVVLLLGSDEGQDRIGLRTDTMLLEFIHKPSGRSALVSIPRNIEGVMFPPGSALAKKYPKGFDDLLNAVYITVENDKDLKSAYSGDGMAAGTRALMETISYTMGIPIDDYLMVNSCAFVKIVDAIGGVTIDIDKALPMPAKLPCSNYRLTPTIGPGPTYMDGTKALGYVRSRKADDDYHRMERQRILLQTIADNIGFGVLITRFDELANAVKENVRTSMTVEEARTMLATLQAAGGQMDSIGLAPPLFSPSQPDWTKLRQIIRQIRLGLVEGVPADLPSPDTTGG